MNLIKIFVWFFIFFLNYALFRTNVVVGIIFLVIEFLIYSRIKGRALGQTFRTQRFRNNKESVESSNATLLVLELMKMERMQESTPEMSEPIRSEEHNKLRKAFGG